MLEGVTRKIWQGTALPPWSAEECFWLFRRHSDRARRPPTPTEREEFAKQLMGFVAIQFTSRQFDTSLPRVGIDPCDAAQDIVAHLLRKVPVMRIRVVLDQAKPTREKVLAMLAVLGMTVYRRAMSLVTERASKVREKSATDSIRRRSRDGADDASVSALPSAAPDRQEDAHSRLDEVLDQAEDRVCGSVPGDIYAVVRLFRYVRRLLRRGEAAGTTFRDLPPHIQRRVTPEQHALVISRTFRIVESAAAHL